MNDGKIQSDFGKAILANKKTIEIRKTSSLKNLINFNDFTVLFINNKNGENLGTLKFSGFIKIKVKDLIHYYKNYNVCKCNTCLGIYGKLDMNTNFGGIKEHGLGIYNYINAEKEIVIFYIEKINNIPEIRCIQDNRLLYKIVNNKQIQTKCPNCKIIHCHILNNKKN